MRGGTRACAGGSDDSPASRAEWTTAHATPNVTAAGAGCARQITVPRKLTDGMRLGTYEPSGVCVGSRAASVKYLGPHSKLALAERHALAAHEAPTSGKLSVDFSPARVQERRLCPVSGSAEGSDSASSLLVAEGGTRPAALARSGGRVPIPKGQERPYRKRQFDVLGARIAADGCPNPRSDRPPGLTAPRPQIRLKPSHQQQAFVHSRRLDLTGMPCIGWSRK